MVCHGRAHTEQEEMASVVSFPQGRHLKEHPWAIKLGSLQEMTHTAKDLMAMDKVNIAQAVRHRGGHLEEWAPRD